MAFQKSSLAKIPISFASCSIGCKESHTLLARLDSLSKAGFKAIELSMPDLIAFAATPSALNRKISSNDYKSLVRAAELLRPHCESRGIEIMMLQPFANFEGWAEGSSERKDAFERARGWIDVMKAVGTDMLQVGSSDTPAEKIGSDRLRFVADLRELADMLAPHGFRLAYENWCWSSHAPDWADVWDIVRQVGRDNVGLCLDTFQTGGGEWADPTARDGLVVAASDQQRREKFAASMQALAESVPADKIYLLQISDAYKPQQPFHPGPDTESQTMPRGRWSHDYRPLPFQSGYLPVVEVTKAVLATGFRGWFSYEVFDSGPDGKGRDYELNQFAQEAIEAHDKLINACCE